MENAHIVNAGAKKLDASGHRLQEQIALPAEYYQKFLSLNAKERRPSAIRSLLPLEATPGLISLLAGKPNPNTFPFTSINFTARSPTDPQEEKTITVNGALLVEGLQYGPTAGIPKLREWLYGLQEIYHGRKQGEGNWSLSVGTGSQDLIYKAIAAMVNPGDSVLVESPVYAGVIPIFQSLHCDQIEVPTDAHGISSSTLRSILESWPVEKAKPKVLYTVPYGGNPTGMTSILERRKEVLRLSREHDFIILEDDPYFYLYYGVNPRYPSYLSLEREEPETGRVLRFDSFSKVLSAGIRIGFASGPAPLMEAIDRHTGTSNLQSSSLTQVIVFSLLDSWGYDGFKVHTETVAQFYRAKRDVFEKAMNKHLAGLAEWITPEAGMFFWFKLVVPGHIDDDSAAIIRTKAFENGVLALPGTVFLPNGRKTGYVRASFSIASEEDVDEAMKRMKEAILAAGI
ncbi:PLP-dependent transferase [Mycena floridula]|nr:PLP-dependent transferase [Mycena floridula]